MGAHLKARCPCGFSRDLVAGEKAKGGRSEPAAPALCPRCRDLVSVDLLADRLSCPICQTAVLLYDDPDLGAPVRSSASGRAGAPAAGVRAATADRGPRVVYEWSTPARSLALFDVEYDCPKCRGRHLRFEAEGALG